ncbi:hypothetical protein Tco_0630700 [Tanacetum coccineum]
MTESPLMDLSFDVPVFSPGDYLIACLNKAMAFQTAVASSRGDNVKVILVLVIRVMLPVLGEKMQVDRNAAWYKDKAMLAEAQETRQILDEEQLIFLADLGILNGQAVQSIIPNNAVFQTEDLDTYDYVCDDISNEKAVLMSNISDYGSDVISEAKQDSMILLVIEQMLEQMINHVIYIGGNIDFGRRESIKKCWKESDPEAIKQNISHKPIDYEKLNRLSDDFGKRFTPQQELSSKQAFWLRISNPTSKPYDASPVKIEAPKELPKPSVDKQCLEFSKKELLLENDPLLQQIMSQDVLLIVMNSMSLIGEFVNMERKRNESCDKCFNLDAELLKS